ncbi:MAG: AAA family ATPase [Candidatus Eremiobacteraeota bacterium]|nr:AAA family ATPase [Candidatus Eremiobacteraeota bacterium]
MIARAEVSPRLVGRDVELSALIARRDAAARAHGSLVLVEGEAGVGKSRLIAQFRDTLSHGRAAVGLGVCREFGTAPYGPIRAAFGGAGCPLPAFAASSRAEELIELRDQVAAACRRRNRVFIFEDLQWADEGSLAFLHYILLDLASLRLLIVGTFRPEDAFVNPAGSYLTRLVRDRNTFRLTLKCLPPRQTRALVRFALGDRALAAAKTEEIVRRSDGNPFFAEELLTNALHSDGTRAEVGLPMTISAAVMERIAKLEPEIAEVATRAAVGGELFDPDMLCDAFGYPAASVLRALRRLRDLNLIVEIGSPPAYAFRHALTRDAIYTSLLAAERRVLHARILRALEVRGGYAARDLGYHAWSALDRERCRRYNELAGDEADALHAYADAVRFYEMALDGDCDRDTRARLLVKAASCASRDGMADRASQFYGAAAAMLNGLASSVRVAELYYAMGNQARVAGDNARAMSIIDDAARALPASEGRARAMLMATSAFMRLDRGDIDAARTLIARAEAASDTPIYQNAVAYAALNRGDVPALRAANAQYARLCAALGSDHELRARFNAAFNYAILGLDAEAIAEFDTLIPEVEAARLSSLQVLSYANAAIVHARAGRWHVARELVERGLAIPEPTTVGPIALAAAGISVGDMLDDAELVERCAGERILECAFTSRINSTLGRVAGPYARWLARQGESDYAAEVLRRAIAAIAAPLGATETILAAAESGDDDTAATARSFLSRLDALSHLDLYLGTAQHLQALDARHCGRVASSESHATEAATTYRRLGWTSHEARALQLAARHERSAAEITVDATARIYTGPLSLREREVAMLAAQGAANRRIAAKLSVSQRTIEKHLTSIYDKLGVRNRAQLAALLAKSSSR